MNVKQPIDFHSFLGMLASAEINYKVHPHGEHKKWIEVDIDNVSPNVDTFSHCFCKFIFDDWGKLRSMSFGY